MDTGDEFDSEADAPVIDPASDPESPEFFQRLERVFQELVELEPSARDSALEGIRSRDPVLAARLESLFAAHSETTLLDRGSIPADESSVAGHSLDPLLALGQRIRHSVDDLWARDPRDPMREVGQRFGGYQLLRPIGVGGMGTVYEALQENPRRKVAIKVMPAGVASRASLRRFEIETEVLARLQHPGIAQIFEAGIYYPQEEESRPLDSEEWSDDGEGLAARSLEARPYFAMELVKGVPLGEYVGRLPLPRRIQIFIKICEAIHYAHAKGVIHRDLKPANVLVDQRGHPKVVDFGVARVADSDVTDSTTVRTAHGQILGTVQYMSPEQASGDPDAVDTRTDVYSLGVILFEILTGELPYRVERRMLHDAIRIIREGEPTRLGLAEPNLRGSDLETIVAKALEKSREHRYQSVLELASDCLRFLRDEPIEARAPNTLYQLGKFARRNRALLLGVVATIVGLGVGLFGLMLGVVSAGDAGSGLLVSVAVGLAGLTIGIISARRALLDLIRQRDLAASAAASAKLESSKAAAMRDFLTSLFTAGIPNRALGRTVTVREAVDVAADEIHHGLAGNPEVQAWANDLLGMSYGPLGELDRAEYHLRTAVRMRRSLLGHDHPDTLRSMENLASILVEIGRADEGEALARQTVDGRERVHGQESVEVLESLCTLCRALHANDKLVDAEQLLREAAYRSSDTLGPDHPVVLAARNDLAVVCTALGRFAEAETLLREVLSARLALYGDHHTDTLQSRVNLAAVLHHRQAYQEASELLNATLVIQEEICGSEHPETLSTLETLADVYRKSDRHYLAAFLYEKLDSAMVEIHGSTHPQRVRGLIKLSSAYLHQERYPAAVSLASRALKILERRRPEGSPEEITVLTNLGFAEHRQQRPEKAVEWFERAVDTAYRVLPPDDLRVAVIEANFATCLIGVGEEARAERLLRQCYSMLDAEAHSSAVFVPRVFRKPLGNLTELHEAWVEETRSDSLEAWVDREPLPKFSTSLSREDLSEP